MSAVRAALERELGAGGVAELASPFLEAGLPLALPRNEAELAAVLQLAARERWRVLPVGSGTKLGWRTAPVRADLALSTRAISGIVEYEPAEGVLTARAGTRLAELRRACEAGGHWLTPLLADEERATLGGVLAAAQSGPDRLRHGPLRHHVLGVRVALADGTSARAGGRLVKNVTGYDLQRLHTGAHGALGVILEASLRLFPLPRAEALVTRGAAGVAEALDLARAAGRTPLRPIWVALARAHATEASPRWTVSAHLGGLSEVLDDELERLRALWPGCRVQRGPAAARAALGERFDTSVLPYQRVECAPSQVLGALERVEAHDASCALVCDPLVATIDVQSAAALDLGALVVRLRNPAAARSAPSVGGAARRALEARLVSALDPEGVLARN